MMLTTKGRYAVMAMADIVLYQKEGMPITLSQISTRQGISLNYLEQIFVKLRKAGIVFAVKGPGGGYILKNDAREVKIIDIISAVDEQIKMIRCEGDTGCVIKGVKCITHNLWDKLGKEIAKYLSSVTLYDICFGEKNVELN